jgi:hypothetical protein
MGFASYHCAKSGQSIPVPHKDPTDCTLFLKDGTTISGVYDGYGRLYQPGTGFPSIDHVMRMVAEKAGLSIPGKDKLYPSDWPQDKLDEVIEEYRKQYPDVTPYALMQGKSVSIFDLAPEDEMKIVKTKYVDPGDSYDTLPVSQTARDQGWNYDYDGQWNEPAYGADAAATPRKNRP